MHRLGLPAALLAVLLSSAPAAAAPLAVPGEILVRFKASAGGSERAAARRSAKVTLKRALRTGDTQLVQTDAGRPTADALAALRRDARVKHAIPNRVYRATATPTDPRFADLWGLHNTGQTVNTVAGEDDKDIDAPEAWDLFNSAPETVVAVVDTGVRLDHPDLAGNLWANDDPAGGGDDDGNGLVDDTNGYDFIDGDGDPSDLEGHGTHVAGTIAAGANDGTGITGVAWDAQIMTLRALDENGAGTGLALDQAFRYAGEEGARVVNASLGGPGDHNDKAYYDDLFDDYPDTLFVVAAGNDGRDNETDQTYPCNSSADNVVCVAATDSTDALAGFSNFGTTSVDLAAPGVSILSTVPTTADTGLAHTFEAGLPEGWSTAGSTGGAATGAWRTYLPFTGYDFGNWLGESPAGGDFSFAGHERLTLASAAYDLSGKDGCVLAYDILYEYDEGRDELVVESSTDGVDWSNERAVYTGTNGGVESLVTNLDADGAAAARFRFQTKADGTDGGRDDWFGALIDNLRVRCAVANGDSHTFLQGTSMATPHVAGVATLLFGARPDAGPAQVRDWLLASGDRLDDPLTGLVGKTVTGRRLNAYNALLAAGVAALVTTGSADAISQTGATLRGTINPDSTPTAYRFEYGTAADALVTRTPTAPALDGSTAVPVLAPITGLAPETTYHYRLVAIRGDVETPGAVRSFTTAGQVLPTLTADPATGVGTTVATVGGTIDPHGRDADVLLEWGTASGVYTEQTNTLAVGGSDVIPLEVELVELTPGTRYFYRLRAQNADGEATSAERSFTTVALPGTPVPPPTPAPVPAAPAGPTLPPGPITIPQPPPVSVTCKLTRAKRVACKAGATVPVRVSVRILKGRKLVARGTAARLVQGRAIRMKTPRRLRRGRYKLQLTVTQGGAVVSTVTKTIRL